MARRSPVPAAQATAQPIRSVQPANAAAIPSQSAPERLFTIGESDHPATIDATGHEQATPPPQSATKPTHDATDGKAYFNEQLALAAKQMEVLQQLGTTLHQKLATGQIGDCVNIEREVDDIESAIIRYNAALERACQTWLDYDLSREDNTRILSMKGPRTLGLPAFTSDNQERRAAHLAAKMGERSQARGRRMDLLVGGLTAADRIGTVAGVVSGAGMLVSAGKIGGKMAVAKVVGTVVSKERVNDDFADLV